METRQLGNTGVQVPVIGMGTWNVAPPDDYAPAVIDEREIIKALRFGIERGLTHIDTAEMYGNGRAERLIGQAIRGVDRSSIFIASKLEPEHLEYQEVPRAAKASLKRLGTDHLDLYQIHWPSSTVPFEETLGAMEGLVDEGIVRFIGVSNFSVSQLQQAQKAMSRHRVVSNQVRYNALDRGIEQDLLPFADTEGITITAYSPFAVGRLFEYPGEGADVVARLARKYGKTPAQVYLSWLVSRSQVIAIPKAVQIKHLEENAAAAGWRMEPQDYEAIDNAFPVRGPHFE